MLKRMLLPILLTTLLCAGCTKSGLESALADRQFQASELDSRVVQAGNAFGLRMHQAVVNSQPGKNVFLSPVSVTMALSMAYNGANGSTREAMAKTLQLQEMPIDDVNRASKVWKDLLTHQGPGVQLKIANSLWSQKGKPFLEDFLQKNREYYGAEVNSLDFSSAKAPGTINGWVKKHTNGKIERIVDGKLDAQTAFLLINAVWFKGEWTRPFADAATKKGSFFTSPGVSRQVSMMSQSGSFEYIQESGYQAVRLPYGKEENAALLVFLPEEGAGLDALQTKLWTDAEVWSKPFPRHEGVLELPRFKLDYGVKLNDMLKSLGMGEAFDAEKADFSGMAPAPPRLAVSEVLHKTFVEVNEKGTEAAAVTSVGMATSAALPKSIFRMTVNRPFVIAIQDRETGSLLFLGSVHDPVS